jgi:hypothetical protein
MKQYIFLSGLAILSALFCSCNDDFLQKNPQTSIGKENFFNTPNDLETYVNGIYNNMLSGGSYEDIDSDNTAYNGGGGTLSNMLRGSISSANIGGWSDWSQLRRINFMLDNVNKATGSQIDINHNIGIARYFRAQFYIGKLSSYSDVPWYNKSLETNDPDLFKAADPRTLVADSILSDLKYAVNNIKATWTNNNKTRVSKYAALALMSRFCLYEGTFRKYHPELKLEATANQFLEESVWACEQLMASGQFEITGTSIEAYRDLFISRNLSGNKEIIQWVEYTAALGRGNNTHTVMGWQWSLSRSLMETYLMKDGKPFTQTPNYDKKTFCEVFVDRDPRMAETFVYPGFKQSETDAAPYKAKSTGGGYDQLKFYPRDPTIRLGWGLNYTGLPLFRYAEVLLNYAEAKAELGAISQDVLDKTVNKIRKRVGMPDLNASVAVDPVLEAYYPNVSGTNKAVILEIRRERRVELACEGRRFDDLNRWYAGKRYEDTPQGMYVPAFGAIDITGDGKPDVAVLASPNDLGPIGNLTPDEQAELAKYYLVDSNGTKTDFYLTNGTSGHIAFNSDQTLGRKFEEPKYYYRPIPKAQLVLNPNLEQPFGWE